jgi:hypothetical protein
MDEEPELINNCPWQLDKVTDECVIFRQTTPRQRSGKPRRFPNESNFALREGEDYLSFNWERYITVDKNYKLIGITHNRNGEFLDISHFTIFKYPAKEVMKIRGVSIEHIPVYHDETPSPVGHPNNPAHLGVLVGESDLAFRTEMTDYCASNSASIQTICDKAATIQEIQEIRRRANETPYHKDWVFEDNV